MTELKDLFKIYDNYIVKKDQEKAEQALIDMLFFIKQARPSKEVIIATIVEVRNISIEMATSYYMELQKLF